MRAFSVRVTARFERLAKRLHKQHADFAAAYERSIRILTIDPTTGQVRILSRSWRIFRLAKVHGGCALGAGASGTTFGISLRSEEHTSELQSLRHLVCRLLLE